MLRTLLRERLTGAPTSAPRPQRCAWWARWLWEPPGRLAGVPRSCASPSRSGRASPLPRAARPAGSASELQVVNTAPTGRLPWEIIDVDEERGGESPTCRPAGLACLPRLPAPADHMRPCVRPLSIPPPLHARTHTCAVVHWACDFTAGRAPDPWRNARLSERTKVAMAEMHARDPKK